MYNTWDIACKIFPFVAGLMLWLVYLLFRGEKPSKELTVSTWKEFYSKCYELEKELANRSKESHANQKMFEMELKAKGKWIERPEYKEALSEIREKISKLEKADPHRNHMIEGYKAFKESKKEVITKPISLIPEYTTIYDIELTRGEYEKEYCKTSKKSKSN